MSIQTDELPDKALGRFCAGFGVTFTCIYILTLFDINLGGFLHACREAFFPALVVGLVLGLFAASGKGPILGNSANDWLLKTGWQQLLSPCLRSPQLSPLHSSKTLA